MEWARPDLNRRPTPFSSVIFSLCKGVVLTRLDDWPALLEILLGRAIKLD